MILGLSIFPKARREEAAPLLAGLAYQVAGLVHRVAAPAYRRADACPRSFFL